MPHYDHLCSKCNKPFVIEMKISEVDKKTVSCPNCKSKGSFVGVTASFGFALCSAVIQIVNVE